MPVYWKIVIAVVLTEALAEILTESSLFEKVRRGKLRTLLCCAYCQSVWIGVGLSFLFWLDVGLMEPWIDCIVMGFIVHRLSNIFHIIISILSDVGSYLLLARNPVLLGEPNDDDAVETDSGN